MVRVIDIYNFIDEFAPFEIALNYDNVGILIGDKYKPVTNVLVATDVTRSVVDEAVKLGVQLIITHHPVIFSPVKSIETNSLVYLLIQSGLSVISAHTNLDISSEFGVNTCLASTLQIKPTAFLDEGGIIGELDKAMHTSEFVYHVCERLGATGVRFTDLMVNVKRVAICGGSGGFLVDTAVSLGADALVTGEIKHNELLRAQDKGLLVVDAGHFKTEDVVIEPLAHRLSDHFKGVEFIKSKACNDKLQYYMRVESV